VKGRGHAPDNFSDPGKDARARAGIPVVPAFDGYRALAILGVVFLHLATSSGVASNGTETDVARLVWGSLGRAVELLFVVSGFVVFLPTVAQGRFGSIKSFAIRRGARLLPAYWMVLLVSLVLLACFDLNSPAAMPTVRDGLFHFVGLQGPGSLVFTDLSSGFGVNLPLWTLSVELCFYLVLPLVALAYLRRPWIGLGLALAVTVAWTIAFDHVGEFDYLADRSTFAELVRLKLVSGLQLPQWAFSFGLGMTGAWVYVRYRERAADPDPAFARVVAGLQAIAVVVLLACVWVLGGDYDQTRASLWLSLVFSTAVGTLMIAITLGKPIWRRPFAAQTLRKLGDMSYGVYLSHMVIVVVLASEISMPEDGGPVAFLTWTGAVLPASLLYGYVSARFLEQPIRRWARRYGRRDEA